MNQNVEIRKKGKGEKGFTGRMEEKGWKGMKLKLGFWIGEEKRVSELTTFPPPMVDITWQSPYIMCMHRLRSLASKNHSFYSAGNSYMYKQLLSEKYNKRVSLFSSVCPLSSLYIKTVPEYPDHRTQKIHRKQDYKEGENQAKSL